MTEAALTAAAFREAGLNPAGFALSPKPGPPTPLRTHLGEDSVLTVAIDAEGRRRNLIEHACRTWAAQHGIDGPAIIRCSPKGHWLHASRVRSEVPEGPVYVHAALDTADRIAGLEMPSLPAPASQWRGSLGSRVMPAARGFVGGLDIASFLRSRRAAAALNDLTTCHGDYYRRNVLSCMDGRVSVVDWEFIGRGPRWTDHLRFWSTLRRSDDRREAWDRITSDLRSGGAEHLCSLTQWLCHRLLAENLAAPRAQRDEKDLAHARRVLDEARLFTARLE